MAISHGAVAKVYASFESVVDALKPDKPFSNIYLEVLNTKPRVAIAVGEKFFFRAGSYVSITIIAIESSGSTIVKAISCGSKESIFDITDFGATKDYTIDSINEICRMLNAHCEIVKEVSRLEANKSQMLKI